MSRSRPRGSSPESSRESRERRTTRDVAGSHSTWVQLHGVASDSVHVARAALGSVMADLKTMRERTSSFNGTGSCVGDATEQRREKRRRIGSEALIDLVWFGFLVSSMFVLCGRGFGSRWTLEIGRREAGRGVGERGMEKGSHVYSEQRLKRVKV